MRRRARRGAKAHPVTIAGLPPGAPAIVPPPPPEYVRKWHVVYDWAREALEPADIEEYVDEYPSDHGRVAGWRGVVVSDPYDDEVAWEEGTPLEQGFDFGVVPSKEVAGRRRVAIRALTYVLDRQSRVAYDARWITTGWGMAPKAAIGRHNRYIREYATAVSKGLESRRLVVVAWEIVFWTAPPAATYV